MGIGSRLYDGLMLEGREKSLHTILASISSLNPRSLVFHKRQGYVECGCLLNGGQEVGKGFRCGLDVRDDLEREAI